MTFPLEICCIFCFVSHLRLGRLGTCQGIYRNQTWAPGVYRAEALPLVAVPWSDQMRGSCHSLRCRFFLSLSMFNLVLRRFSLTCLVFFITSILRSIQAKRLMTWLHMIRTWTNLQSLDRYSRKNRVRKEHVGTVVLQICRTHWRPNSCRWSRHLKNWLDRSSQLLDDYSAYVDSFRPDFLVFLFHGSPDCLEDPTIFSGSLRSTLDVFEEYQDPEIVS